MNSAVLGIVLDSSALIAAERRHLTAAQALEKIQQTVGELPVAISTVTIAEVAHGVYRANTQAIRDHRRAFLEELKATIPIYALTVETAEIVARIGAGQAARGISIPLANLMVGACALELSYGVATANERDFKRIPGLSSLEGENPRMGTVTAEKTYFQLTNSSNWSITLM
jgi:tRNA(fMet)-specific endonuclease VapC